MTRLFIDLHVVQSVPPSNLNRDDTGSPKSAFYGGVRRSRVSSQAWKKATRAQFVDRLDAADLGTRTKRVVELMVARMTAQDGELSEDVAEKQAVAVLAAMDIKPKAITKKKGEGEEARTFAATDYLIFFSTRQIERLAELASAGGKPTKRAALEAADQEHGIEVALFGRMVADNKDLSVDAAVQVAHAISTHGVVDESDYFTAVDDETPTDETGAGMLGTVEFNSATLYRYATINVAGLLGNLGDSAATVRAVQEFVRAFVLSMPTGKQNTFANRTLPDAVVVMVRHDQPVNLVGAFEDAVEARDSEGRVAASVDRLVEQAASVSSFVDPPDLTLVSRTGRRTAAVDALGERVSLDEIVARVGDVVAASTKA